MKVIKIDKKDWAEGLGKLTGTYRLFGPVKDKESHDFKELGKDEQPDMDFFNTRLSAKSAIFPQTESMFEYSLDENEADHHVMKEVEKDYSPRAVLGIRPCDAAAFLLVKRNFDNPEYRDPWWVSAYEATTFVGLACNEPASTCFCTTAGCGPFHEEGMDVLLADAGDHYFAKSLTDKGAKLLDSAGWKAEAEADIDAMKKEAEGKIGSAVTTDKLKDKVTTELYDAPFWEDVAFACLNCGTCTYVCPTCWCFDIQDETHGNKGLRMRNWDSCMYPLFSLHGTGHNPRGTKVHRVRQRFMHKLKYYVDKYGDGIQCVGCGRCIRSCPVNIDIREVCELMNSHDQAACACPAA
ncbi:MAG: 4Fe-4S ferredoxin [Desulfobacteraceae bacterium 4572_88]|nr:MAG: 4Fe-4S ferredoxin [Desulfobacteraceae bacterium 4572_88]